MGFFDVFKKSRKQVNKENQEQGRAGEKKIKEEYEFSGYKVTRTGKGHDFKAEKKLREVLGHTPLEALFGVLLGLAVGQILWFLWK